MEMKGNALIIKGNKNLNGYLEVSGAKNSALPNIAATILTDEEVIETVIENAALEPEIVDLALLLKKMGANIEGEGTPVIKVKGVKKLHGTRHRIIPDRIEAATFAILSAITNGNIVIKNYPKSYLEYVNFIFKKIGINVIDLGNNQIIVKREQKLLGLKLEQQI